MNCISVTGDNQKLIRMKLKDKDEAIDFEATDYLGNKIQLFGYAEKKVLLTFFRAASCPFCNMRVNELITNYSKFEENEIGVGPCKKRIIPKLMKSTANGCWLTQTTRTLGGWQAGLPRC